MAMENKRSALVEETSRVLELRVQALMGFQKLLQVAGTRVDTNMAKQIEISIKDIIADSEVLTEEP
eukprot:491677-Karenia_brevis.AAC.1